METEPGDDDGKSILQSVQQPHIISRFARNLLLLISVKYSDSAGECRHCGVKRMIPVPSNCTFFLHGLLDRSMKK